MVTCKLYGRMGNQMFQIAATIALALRNKTDYIIPKESANPELWPRYFDFPVEEVNIPKRKDKRGCYAEKNHYYEPLPYWDGIILDGYFQSEKYFSDFRAEIINAFGLYYSHWKDIVSVHVRRGDYTELADKHPPVTVEYIREAMERMLQIAGNDGLRFLFFSDDIEWCREHFPDHSYSSGRTVKDDMMLMACCGNNIIANSSFSWWGAWLNQNPEKIVVAPKIWFGPGNAHLDTKDLLPESWIKI